MKYSSYLPAYGDGTDSVFQNVSIYNSDAGELPRRKHATFRTWRKFEIKNYLHLLQDVVVVNSSAPYILVITRYQTQLQKHYPSTKFTTDIIPKFLRNCKIYLEIAKCTLHSNCVY
jgi:hypothetical protein